MISLVCFWSDVKSLGTHQAKTFDMPGEMPTVLAIWLTVKHLSTITIQWCFLEWWMTVTGRPGLGSFSRLLLSLLNSTVHFCTVDKAGVSSPNVATMSVWMPLGANPLFCRYLITPRCQTLSIFTKCLWYYYSKSWRLNYLSSVGFSGRKQYSYYQERLNLMHAKFHCCGTASS